MNEQGLDEYRARAEERIGGLRSELDDLAEEADERIEEGADQLTLAGRERLEEAENEWRRAELRLQDLRQASSEDVAESKEALERAEERFDAAVGRAAEALDVSRDELGPDESETGGPTGDSPAGG